MDLGIFVIMDDASIVTTEVGEEVGLDDSTKDGTAKLFGCQSSKKNPTVFATAGSTGGGTVPPVFPPPVFPPPGFVILFVPFLHENPNIITAIKEYLINFMAVNYSCF
jgi:hypothetical protein